MWPVYEGSLDSKITCIVCLSDVWEPSEKSHFLISYFHPLEIDLLEDTRLATVTRKLKAQFARHVIPEMCVSDNGSQLIPGEFKEFSYWSFAHVTSSPEYPKSNGKVEAAVKSVKAVTKKYRNAKRAPYLARLEHSNTPSQGIDSSWYGS